MTIGTVDETKALTIALCVGGGQQERENVLAEIVSRRPLGPRELLGTKNGPQRECGAYLNVI